MMRINLMVAKQLIKFGMLERSQVYLARAIGNANTEQRAALSAIFHALNALRSISNG